MIHTEQKRKYLVLALSGLVLLAALITNQFPGDSTFAQDKSLVWAKVDGAVSPTDDLNCIFMRDQNNAWAVGSTGTEGIVYRLRWQNNHWINMSTARFRAPLHSISAITDSNIWAVGEHGLIVHLDASGWHEVANPLPDATLSTIQMLGDGEEGWAAGDTPDGLSSSQVLLHYRDGGWTVDSSLSGSTSVTGLHFAPGGGWAVGPYRIWQYSNSSGNWTAELTTCRPGFHPNCVGILNGVRAISTEEAWAVGFYEILAGGMDFGPTLLLLHRTGSEWQEYASAIEEDPMTANRAGTSLRGISFSHDGYGMAVGFESTHERITYTPHPLILSYRPDRRWHYEQIPWIGGSLHSISHVDSTHALAVGTNGIILSYGYGGVAPEPRPTPSPLPGRTPLPGPVPTTSATNPTSPVSDPRDPNVTYLPVVGHTLGGGFRDYWLRYGGLEQFGYPLTEEFTEINPTDNKPYTTQYFERARFEYHPGNRPPYDILLGLLGRTVTIGRESEGPFKRVPALQGVDILYFEQTGHNVPPQFAGYWQSHGGLPVYGYPITEAFSETSVTDGKQYLVQYFERNRFEYHPELDERYKVSLGLLGVEVLKMKQWLPR